MRALDLFPSRYLKAADLKDRPHDVTIVGFEVGIVGESEEERPVVLLEGFDKGLVLNVGNTTKIGDLYGDETDDWIGKRITIKPSECDLRGKTVPCIRVVAAAPKDRAKRQANTAKPTRSTARPAASRK